MRGLAGLGRPATGAGAHHANGGVVGLNANAGDFAVLNEAAQPGGGVDRGLPVVADRVEFQMRAVDSAMAAFALTPVERAGDGEKPASALDCRAWSGQAFPRQYRGENTIPRAVRAGASLPFDNVPLRTL